MFKILPMTLTRNLQNSQCLFIVAFIFAVNMLLIHFHSPYSYRADQFMWLGSKLHATLPKLIVVTPTYNRSAQIPDLVRLKQTLNLVPHCDWIVVEDALQPNDHVYNYIRDFKSGALLYVSQQSRDPIFRGKEQRNKALQLIRRTASKNPEMEAVVYFADDDNSYDSNFLHSLRYTKQIAIFNVGLVTNRTLEGPLVENNTVIGFRTGFFGNRSFCIDMAGFAVNIQLLLKFPESNFSTARRGRMETEFLSTFNIPLNEFEYFHGKNGIHVWHTQTKNFAISKPDLTIIPANKTATNILAINEKDAITARWKQRKVEKENAEKKVFFQHLQQLNSIQREELVNYLTSNDSLEKTTNN